MDKGFTKVKTAHVEHVTGVTPPPARKEPSVSTSVQPAPTRTSARVHVQKFGTFLSNMVMPNIGAFIAWGFITSLFIEKGWLNTGGSGGLTADSWVARIGGWGVNAASCADKVVGADGKEHALSGFQACGTNGGIVGPMIVYLLPLLIAYTGGKIVYDVRGGVVGAIATMGVITGTSIPMFMGAMVMGPLGGWSIKKLDAIWSHKIRPGFEMLVNNFAAGIWGLILAVFGFFVVGPKLIMPFADVAGSVVKTLVNNGLLPLTSIFIEPAKVLFLNNAINHGVLTPLGIAQASGPDGKSILFLLEANPAGGLGLLLAYSLFGRGMAKASAPGAAIIHFFGGIHEIYFPYVLAKPRLILAMIAGGMTQIFVNVLFHSGLRAPAAPGSIIAVYSQTPGDSLIGVTLSWILGATATFLVASILLKADKSDDEGDLTSATASMEAMKGKKSSISSMLTGGAAAGTHSGPIHSIVFACDAGMGSSAMGASVLRKKVMDAGYRDVTVVNKAIANLTDTFDLVVSHQDLTPRAREKTGSAVHVSVDNFMNSPRYDEIVDLLGTTNRGGGDSSGSAGAAAAAGAGTAAAATAVAVATDAPPKAAMLARESIVLHGHARTRDEAITEAGELLVAAGAVDPSYLDAMHEREKSVSTYVGNLLAIPHGTNEAKTAIRRSAISFVRYSGGIDWNGKPVKFAIGIAGAGDDHLAVLQQIAEVFLKKEKVAELEAATSAEDVQRILGGVSV